MLFIVCGELGIGWPEGQPCEKGLEMLKTQASISSDVSVDFFSPDDSDVDEAVMSCMEIDSDDESDDYIDVVM